jgi:signal peptidase II
MPMAYSAFRQLWADPLKRSLSIAGGIVLVDQATKIAVKLTMKPYPPHNQIVVAGDWLKIHFVENPGAAFGMTFGEADGSGKILLTLLSIALAGLIAYFLIRTARFPTRLPLFISFILGGAVGNIIDRVFYGLWFAERNDYEGGFLLGQVVDMIYIDIWQGVVPTSVPFIGGTYMAFWPVFNIADVAIFTGIVVILLFNNRLFPDETKTTAATDSQPAEPSGPTETGNS